MNEPVRHDAEEFAHLARALADTQGFEPKLRLLVDEAVRLVPCTWAAVAVSARLSKQPARLSTTSDEQLGAVIARIASRAGTSPGIDAFTDGTTVHSPDLAQEQRYPEYRDGLLEETSIRSVLSTALAVHDTTIGVLTLYSDHPNAFDDATLERARLFTEHASVAMAAELSEDKAGQLETALASSRTIGAAVGILVERLRIPPAHAFERLRAASQHSNRKVSDVATELVDTGTLGPDLQQFITPR